MVLGLWKKLLTIYSKKKGAWNEVLINEYLLFNSDVLWKIDSLSILYIPLYETLPVPLWRDNVSLNIYESLFQLD